jgi:hypothetical protein
MSVAGQNVGDTATNGEERGGSVWTSYSTRDRTLLTVGSVLCYVIFHFLGRAFRIPEMAHYQASLLANPSPAVAIVLTAVTFAACVLVGSLIAGTVHFEGGLFCACVGLLALSTRGGPMRYVLMDASGGSSVWVRMLTELALLSAIVGGGWYLLRVLRDQNFLRGEPLREDDPETLPGQGLMALAATVIGTLLLVLVLAQTDKKAQVVWAVAIASFFASMAAHSLFPARPSVWFWAAPLIVAAIGYLSAVASGQILPGGQVGGMLPALARPLPLDYASVGPAAALLGYWTSRKWQHEHEEEPQTTGEVEEALEEPGR